MAEGFSDESSKKKKKRDSNNDEDDDVDASTTSESDQNEKPAATQEELDVAALKAEIAEYEKTLAAKKSALQYTLDQCEEYSKTGYARKVAEMENMRRVRSVRIYNTSY
jgi:molecular chaperone GrpE (heat shock protein)